PLPPEDRLSEAITILISRAMREDLEAQARAEGFRSLSQFIRERKLARASTGKSRRSPLSYYRSPSPSSEPLPKPFLALTATSAASRTPLSRAPARKWR